MNNFEEVLQKDGIPFIKALLDHEKKRFNESFLRGSVYEQINADFGIFPKHKVYPAYFTGNIQQPENKYIFIGINPGYDFEINTKECKYLEEEGLFNGYCNIFHDYFGQERKGLIPYFAAVIGFLRRVYDLDGKINTWEWAHKNLISLELIPYHSKNASGLRINDLKEFKNVYFKILIKFLKYLKPKGYIFINGFPTFKNYFSSPEFSDVIFFSKKSESFWAGKIDEKYDFIGLPFLNRPKGGKDKLATSIKRFWIGQ